MDWISFSLLTFNKLAVQRLKPVTALDTYEGASKNFHPEGLYSTNIFGPIGSEERMTTFGYIDLGVEIISPALALTLYELKRLYKDILAGKRHAIWDSTTKDFELASPGDEGANTGYSFFMEHLDELTPRTSDSPVRTQSIDLLNRYRKDGISRYVAVLPAGVRDLEITPRGQEKEDDINPLYRKLISTARNIPNLGSRNNAMINAARWKLQDGFCDIYLHLFNILDGKKGYIRGKWSKRNIQNGTRNVLSSMDASSPVMDREDEMRATDTILGLYQGIKSLLPVAIHAIRTRYLPPVDAGNGSLYLIDRKTLTRKMVSVGPEDYDKYTTDEGVEKIINSFNTPEYRHKALSIDGMYIALIYNDGKRFKVFYDKSELPEEFLLKHVSGITLSELLYLSGYDIWNDYFTLVTRYPVAGLKSTYPSTIRLTTTARTTLMYELEDDWESLKKSGATDFPRRDVNEFFTSMAPHPSNLLGLTADFDGDTGSGDSMYTEESLAELRAGMRSAAHWVSTDNTLTVDVNVDTISRTLHNLLA